jgi:hypothetical protein
MAVCAAPSGSTASARAPRERGQADLHRIGAQHQRREHLFVAHAHGDGLHGAKQIDLVLSPLPQPQVAAGLPVQRAAASGEFLHGHEDVPGVRRSAFPSHVRHQAVGGRLRAGNVTDFRIRHSPRANQVQLDVLLLHQHADAIFCKLALQPALRRVQQRPQPRIGELRARGVVQQRARQRQCVFGLRIRRCG